LSTDDDLRKLEELEQEIDRLEVFAKGLGDLVARQHPDRSVLGYQAEWHVRGVLYHLRNVYGFYNQFAHEVAMRAGATGADVLLMHAPVYQKMLFEFYALVNLCRISLDRLRDYLGPFIKKGSDQLPKSVRDVLKGSSDCPVYTALKDQEIAQYLFDLRDCLVHYRTLAVSHNATVVREGVDLAELELDRRQFVAATARGSFREVGDTGISVNVLLPDRIFDVSQKDKLIDFTYQDRRNLLSVARSFGVVTVTSLVKAIGCLAQLEEPAYEFKAKPRGEPH